MILSPVVGVENKVIGESAGDSDAGAPCEGDLTDRRRPAALVIFFSHHLIVQQRSRSPGIVYSDKDRDNHRGNDIAITRSRIITSSCSMIVLRSSIITSSSSMIEGIKVRGAAGCDRNRSPAIAGRWNRIFRIRILSKLCSQASTPRAAVRDLKYSSCALRRTSIGHCYRYVRFRSRYLNSELLMQGRAGTGAAVHWPHPQQRALE